MIWVHDELFRFFKSLKDLKQIPKKEKQQAGKKADEAKAMFTQALKVAPAYHRGRRVYLSGLLEQQGRQSSTPKLSQFNLIDKLVCNPCLRLVRIHILSPDFIVQELPRINGAEDGAPDAASRAVQVRGRLGGQAPEQHSAEKAGPGHSR